MAYNLYFSDPRKTSTISVLNTVEGTGLNDYDTSLDLVGSGYNNYGAVTAQNFLKLLENFSSPNAPENAIEGQLWYDTSNASKKVLRVNNGTITSTRWQPAGGIYNQANDPSKTYSSVVTEGDLWVDTSTAQLKLRYDSSWITVGPNASFGLTKTGSEAVVLESSTGSFYPVILNWVNGKVVEIISFDEFLPRSIIDGFSLIKKGINLTNKIVARFNGIADKAFSLQKSNGVIVPSDNVLQNNVDNQVHTGTFIIENGSGLSIKNTTFNRNITILNDSTGGNINFNDVTASLKIGIQNQIYLRLNPIYKNIGINTVTNASSPMLDVYGSGKFSGKLTINVSTASVTALDTNGTVYIGSTATIGGGCIINGSSSLRGIVSLGIPGSGGITILKPATHDSYDLGSTSSAFRSIYASTIGSTGTTKIYGMVDGTVTKLETLRNFQITGQVTSTSITFDGTSDVIFAAELTRTAIVDQLTTSTTNLNQTLLVVNTSTNDTPIENISKRDFLSDIYTNILYPGMIVAYSTSTVPDNFLLCDGSSYSSTTYNNLYSVIGQTYGGGAGVFNVPDLTTATIAAGNIPIFYIIKT